MAERICVTGAAGQAGRAVVRDLREHGYEVLATDIAVSEADRFEGMLRADLTVVAVPAVTWRRWRHSNPKTGPVIAEDRASAEDLGDHSRPDPPRRNNPPR